MPSQALRPAGEAHTRRVPEIYGEGAGQGSERNRFGQHHVPGKSDRAHHSGGRAGASHAQPLLLPGATHNPANGPFRSCHGLKILSKRSLPLAKRGEIRCKYQNALCCALFLLSTKRVSIESFLHQIASLPIKLYHPQPSREGWFQGSGSLIQLCRTVMLEELLHAVVRRV